MKPFIRLLMARILRFLKSSECLDTKQGLKKKKKKLFSG